MVMMTLMMMVTKIILMMMTLVMKITKIMLVMMILMMVLQFDSNLARDSTFLSTTPTLWCRMSFQAFNELFVLNEISLRKHQNQ